MDADADKVQKKKIRFPLFLHGTFSTENRRRGNLATFVDSVAVESNRPINCLGDKSDEDRTL